MSITTIITTVGNYNLQQDSNYSRHEVWAAIHNGGPLWVSDGPGVPAGLHELAFNRAQVVAIRAAGKKP